MKKTFAELFKKYRLRAEFETLTELGNALGEKGLFYEDSLFSHWQKGKRIPHERNVLITLTKIFIEKGAISTINEANEFLETTGQGFLTKKELETLPLLRTNPSIFQVPSDIENFTGRKKTITFIKNSLEQSKLIFIHGQPGLGKTTLAIKLAHIFHSDYSDGVLWYKVDSSRITDILSSIAASFEEDISNIEDVEIRASIVRSLLSKKRVLLILDSADQPNNLHLLLPNSTTCLTIITSRNSYLQTSESYVDIPLSSFSGEEVFDLFESIIGKTHTIKNKKTILAIGEKVGNLPLAVKILAKQLQQSHFSPTKFLEQLNHDLVSLTSLSYEDKNLSLAIQLSFNNLSSQEKKVFTSLGIFEGKDFSVEAVSFINNISEEIAMNTLDKIESISLIEYSIRNRYRIHPMIRKFAKEKMTDVKIYSNAARYYEQLLLKNEEKKNFKTLLKTEADNIICIFNNCYTLEYWNEVTKLWKYIEKFLETSKNTVKIRPVTEKLDIRVKFNIFHKVLSVFLCVIFIFWVLLQISGFKTNFWNYLFSLSYTLIPLLGGFIGILIAKSWGVGKSTLGKAIFFVSFGLLLWGVGNTIWGYYNLFLNISAPYPSIADILFFPGYLSWIIGIIYVSLATGVKFGLKEKKNKFLLVIIPSTVILVSYYFLVGIEKKGIISSTNQFSLKFFLDLAYPTCDVITLTLALIIIGISFKFFGGKYKIFLYILLFSFVLMYFADFIFSYTTTNNTFFNGDFGDLIFTIALFFMTFGILGFYRKQNNNIIA